SGANPSLTLGALITPLSTVDREALESSSLGFQPSACSVSATDPTKKARCRGDTWPLHAYAAGKAQVSQAQRKIGQTLAAFGDLFAHRLAFTLVKPTPRKHRGLVLGGGRVSRPHNGQTHENVQ